MMTNEATTDHMRTVAEALGWEIIEDYDIGPWVALDGGPIYLDDTNDLCVALAHATADLARRGIHLSSITGPHAGFFSATTAAPRAIHTSEDYDPTSVESTVAAGLAACAEAVGMIGGGT